MKHIFAIFRIAVAVLFLMYLISEQIPAFSPILNEFITKTKDLMWFLIAVEIGMAIGVWYKEREIRLKEEEEFDRW